MHEKQANPTKNRAPMIRYHSHKQLSLAEFDKQKTTIMIRS